MKKNLCEKIPWRYVVLVALVCLGVFVHWPECGDGSRLGYAFSCAISSFFPSRGDYPLNGTTWLYWFFHIAVVLYAVYVVVEYIGKNLANRWALFIGNKWIEELNIFWTDNEESFCLAKSMSQCEERTARTVFVFPGRFNSDLGDKRRLLEDIKRQRGRWMFGKPEDFSKLKSLHSRKQCHFFLGADSYSNVAMARALTESMEKTRDINSWIKLEIYVRVSSEADDDLLYMWADKYKESGNLKVDIYIVREEGVVSRDFLYWNPMLESPTISFVGKPERSAVCGKFNVLLIGFGMQGQRLLNDMICDAQFLDGNGYSVPLSFDVIDKDSSSYGWYEKNCSDACKKYKIDFRCEDVRSAAFWDVFLQKGVMKYNRIVICTGDDELNVRVANDISHVCKLSYNGIWKASVDENRPLVFCRIRNKDICEIADDLLREDISWRYFGNMKSVYRKENFRTEGWWRAAMRLNGIYCKKASEDDNEAWQTTSMFDKESSLASVFFQRNILLMFGFDIREESLAEFDLGEYKGYVENNDWFAKIEHMRWMAFHFVRGIKLWNPDESEDINELSPNFYIKKRIRKHAALVEYEKLGDVDDRFKSSLKDKDKDLLKGLEAIQFYTEECACDKYDDCNRVYTPAPKDLDSIELPEEINGMIEELAVNVHEIWAKGRCDSGWKYGKRRNEKEKTHSCLVPYNELSEKEKQYDRETVVGTLKLLCKKGYSFKRGACESSEHAN